ncbi:ABC transporter ATP-binding protein YxdL [bioreactor metagenome]|uniref:ABC transporter ATP-binding protein YxdL n=1 Tax=bioreactor metagenome TaxID=1076179 RepID=A0A645DU17_9ZZZZ
MTLLDVIHVKKIYTTFLGGQKVEALTDASFSVEQGEFVAIMGESGSGKTTLLNILAALDKPTEGQVLLEGRDLGRIKDKEVSAFRRDSLGFVFQDFNLLDTFSVRDNILLPLVLAGKGYRDMEPKLTAVADILHISDILSKFPYEISGGQKQRAAVARAIVTSPKIVLADEPTGALDSKASQNLLKTFAAIHQRGQTILMVTHSAMAASFASRVLFISDGVLFSQLYRGEDNNRAFFDRIVANLSILGGGDIA